MGTILYLIRKEFGHTKRNRFVFACVSTILALNTSERRTQNILLMLYVPITKQQWIGQAKIIVVSTSNGTTSMDTLIYPLTVTSKKLYTNYNIRNQQVQSMPHMNGISLYTVAIVNILMNQTALHYLTKKIPNMYNPQLAPCYTTQEPSNMLVALNDIGIDQSYLTQKAMEKVKQLLDYAATYPNAAIRYYASDMILHAESDAAYLVLPKTRSRIAGYCYLSSKPQSSKISLNQPQPNGPILVECKTLKDVVASAAEAEAETGGLFLNGQTAVIIRIILEALNHKQPPTPLNTENSTSSGFANSHIRIKRAKSWDMRFNWLRCRENQQQLNTYWEKEKKTTKLITSQNILPQNIIKK